MLAHRHPFFFSVDEKKENTEWESQMEDRVDEKSLGPSQQMPIRPPHTTNKKKPQKMKSIFNKTSIVWQACLIVIITSHELRKLPFFLLSHHPRLALLSSLLLPPFRHHCLRSAS